MYLKKLEIQGFKSFAQKNTLTFPGMIEKNRRGITAIVGPNGSGKSNVADAVRWALGEQSMKTLRGKKTEDVIFSGSSKKTRLSMAEVSLYLNNEARQAPIDYSELIITRRIYRNGESEYLINNSRVRLSEIQMLLAKSKFGQKTYSVIGQGIVEGFLNSSMSEKKEFFDEATGVKQFQIKRDSSLNKLRASHENLNQAKILLLEIEPRLKSLTRQVNRLQKRDEIDSKLKNLQLKYYSKIWQDLNKKFTEFNDKFLNKEKLKIEKDKKLAQVNDELTFMRQTNGINQNFNELQHNLSVLQNKKNDINKKLAITEARQEIKMEAEGKFDLSWLNHKKSETENSIEKIKEEINSHNKRLAEEKNIKEKLNLENKEIQIRLHNLNKKLNEVNSWLTDEGEKIINKNLNLLLKNLEEVEKENDYNKIKAILRKIKQEIKRLLEFGRQHKENKNLENVQQEIDDLTQLKERLASETNKNLITISTLEEKIKLYTERKEQVKDELDKLESKLKQKSNRNEDADIEQKELKENLAQINNKIDAINKKLEDISGDEEKRRNQLFDTQKKSQDIQKEINHLNLELNELKINSTRLETKLEDLETEIRQNHGSLKKIRGHKINEEILIEETKEKITHLKRQLDLIGSIDPETEKEHKETKERYDFLFEQSTDLTKTIISLEKIVKELDLIIKECFDKEFKLISRKFEEYFKILFGGGKANIIKIVENSPAKEEGVKEENGDLNIREIKFLQKHNATGLAGIEIQATPPGKKIKAISMLSGGERALTALALICAIININPSPFVVLDEVDAALDEANSERLAKILNDLSYKTQFIIITHNRASMKCANTLYGITMGDDGVSKLLSIKLEENKKLTDN